MLPRAELLAGEIRRGVAWREVVRRGFQKGNERLFLEKRRRTKIIPHAFGERPVLKLMYAAVIRAADRWRGIQVGEFEQRQLRAIRQELNRAHGQRVAPAVPAAPTLVRKLRK